MEEDSMTGSIGTIGISDVVEHDDGSATYTFEMTKDLSELCGEYGLKLLLFCGVLGKNPDSVLRELERDVEIMVGLEDE